MKLIDTIDICEVCRTVADGQPSMGDAAWQAECAVAGDAMARNWPSLTITGDPHRDCHAESDEDCPDDCDGSEGWFSWSSCDGCGNTDGGHRWPAVVLGPDD